jgi:hypothetical protein
VRNFLAAIKIKIARKGASSEEIVAILRRDHPNAIRLETADLIHIALIKLANDTCSLKSGPASTAQLELFAEYATDKMITLRTVDGKGRIKRVHKAVDSLELVEARQYIEERTKPKPRQAPEIRELARLVDDMDKYKKSDHSTIGECWAIKQGRG